MQFEFKPVVVQRDPRARAAFILDTLRHEVGLFPKHATPKYPLPSIMQTEAQLTVLREAIYEAQLPLWSLGATPEELDEFLAQARVLRARYVARQLRHGQDVCAMRAALDRLVAVVPDILTGCVFRALPLRNQECSAWHNHMFNTWILNI